MIAPMVVLLALGAAAGWREESFPLMFSRFGRKFLVFAALIGCAALGAAGDLGLSDSQALFAAGIAFTAYGFGIALMTMFTYLGANFAARVARR
jgi:hypothetical protein